MTGGGIGAAVQIPAQLAAVMCDPGLVVPDVAGQSSVPVPGKGWRHTHSYHQKNSSNRAFHIFFLRPQFAATDRNTRIGEEFRRGGSYVGVEAGNPCQEGDIVARTFPRGPLPCAGK